MRLLICTQKVDIDDPILGFFHRWIVEFAKHFESVVVVCLEEGRHELPENVRVLSLGKEAGISRAKYVRRFYSYIWRERKNYDAVFVHMNQIYVILGGLFWKAWNKRIGLWYTHRAVHLQLRFAACLADEIFTAAPESFGLKTNKLHVIGHGIDVERFAKETHRAREGLRLVSIGRVTHIKHLETLIEAVGLLRRESIEVDCTIVGSPVTADDDTYFNELKESVKSKGLQNNISFKPAVPQSEIAAYYHDNDININLTPTGGIDKVVLEGMAAGCLPIVSNEAFKPIFGDYADKLIFKFQDPIDLAAKIKALWHSERSPIAAYLLEKVRADFDVRTVVGKISEVMLG